MSRNVNGVGTQIRKLLGFCLFALLLCGCGGDGDGDGDTANSPPVADAGVDQTVHLTGSATQVITLTGTASDPDGSIVSHQWASSDGNDVVLTGANTNTATFTVSAIDQTYTFSYTVTDNDGASASDEVNIIVNNNSVPTVDAGDDQVFTLSTSETRTITLTATDSDSDGQIVNRQWTQTDGTDVGDLTGAHTNSVTFSVGAIAQTYTFQYTATDDNGAESSDEVNITINLNSVPVADAGSDQWVNENTSVTLNANGSTDSDGSVESYTWTQTAGTTVTLSDTESPQPTFTAPQVGENGEVLTFELTATDNLGGVGTDTVTVYVSNIIFSDAFADLSNWQTVDDTGNGTENWSIDSGTLRQSINLDADGHMNGLLYNSTTYHIGTYAYVPSLSGLSDYRFSVEITPPYNGTGSLIDCNDVGIMFRRQDADSYYRVSMNARFGFTRFEKVNNGTISTILVNSIGFVGGQPFTMTVEANGDTFIVWIDEIPVFAFVDSNPIATGTVALYCQDWVRFDNVLITGPTLRPTVAISTPLAYSVALTEDDGNDLTTQAVVLNAPTGGSVGFVLDDGTEVTASASDNVYSYTFSSVTDGEHELMAILRDADGNAVSSDINATIGVGGDYIITVGDSITNGYGDNDSSNNDSTDGRIVAIQGYQAPLADALTDYYDSISTPKPHIIFNEGIGGDATALLENRIASILERHPNANKVLMMIGTNDSNAPVATNVYQASVTNIVNAIESSGNSVWLAQIMPTNGDTTRDAAIADYNTVIRNLANADSSDDIFLGPNFYDAFDNNSGLYMDELHPNDSGYQVMADGWLDAL